MAVELAGDSFDGTKEWSEAAREAAKACHPT